MELRKVIIDGKEYYEAIEDTKNEAAAEGSEVKDLRAEAKAFGIKVADTAKDIGIKTAGVAKDIGLKTAEVAKDIGAKTAGVAKDIGLKTAEVAKEVGKKTVEVGVKVKDGAKATGERIASDMKSAGQKIKEGAERLFAKDRSLDPDSKEAKLIKLLPYMSRSEAHDAVMRFLENDSALMRIDLSAVLPFISGEDCNALFLKCIELGKRNIDIATVMQFVDPSVLSGVVDGFLEGKYPKLDIDEFYPFLEDKDIKRIFDHIVGE